MCAISGLVALGGFLPRDATSIAIAMADAQLHRGPDAGGSWSDQRVAFGHRRLAIIDLSAAGMQPMHSQSERYTVVFNGEIFNYRSISSQLAEQGWRPQGQSDTEVLLAAVERWGLEGFLDVADGQFAFALYDHQGGKAFLVRDRFGEKPLAYCVCNGVLAFASELRAFDHVPCLDLELDLESTEAYFRFGHVPGTATIFATVSKVAPATYLEIDLSKGALTARTYWTVPARRPSAVSGPERQDLIAATLSQSVHDRLVSDRPIGAFLSGGIDSSLVCALAAQHTTGPLKTFTMGWDDSEYDESAQANRVANALGADHRQVRLSRRDVVESVDRLGSVMDEPFADSSQLAVLLVSSAARRDVVVALSGDGGDELFAGYNRHRWLTSVRRIRSRIPARPRERAASALTRLAPTIDRAMRPIPLSRRPRLMSDKIHKFAGAMSAPSLLDSYQGLIAMDPTQGRPKVMRHDIRTAMESPSTDELLWAIRSADATGYMSDDVLTKVDRATMAVSLESRTPFLHRGLAEIAFSMDASELIAKTGGKQPLRRMLDELLPGVNFNQPKMGFGVPIADLLRCELRPALRDAASTFESRQSPIVINWNGMADRLDLGDDRPAPMLWALLMFELWASSRSRPITWA